MPGLLGANPRHRSLQPHEIDALTDKYSFKVFEACVENNTPAAGRVFWAYGPDKGDITILGVEPRPEDKYGACSRIMLSGIPAATPKAPLEGRQPV